MPFHALGLHPTLVKATREIDYVEPTPIGFVEMKTEQEAQAAIAALNGQDSCGRALTVNEAKPRTEGGRGGSGGGRGYGGGRGGSGGGYGGRRY